MKQHDFKSLPFIMGKKGYVNTPQFPGTQTGLSIAQVQKLIREQKKTRGYNWSVANGTSVFNLELSGTARIFLGFALMPVITNAGALDINAMPEEFNITINSEIVTDQTHPVFYTQLLNDMEFYFLPRPLSGTDVITATWQNAGIVQNWVAIVYYI